MKIIIESADGANHYIASSYATAFSAAGYDVVWWDTNTRSTYDIFDENSDAELFLGHTWKLNRSVVKNLIKFKSQLKVVLFANHFGVMDEEITAKYPIETASETEKTFVKELLENGVNVKKLICQYFAQSAPKTHGLWEEKVGVECVGVPLCADVTQYYLSDYDENYKTDIFYCGGHWPYKSKYLNKYLLPLCYPNSKYKVKIVGSGWSTPNCVGRASEDTVRRYYRNAKVVPALFEPHTEIVGDLPQRIFQVGACGGFQISQNAVDLDLAFNQNELMIFNNEEDFNECLSIATAEDSYNVTKPFRRNVCLKVYKEHTNFHRAATLMGLFEEITSSFDIIAADLYQQVLSKLK